MLVYTPFDIPQNHDAHGMQECHPVNLLRAYPVIHHLDMLLESPVYAPVNPPANNASAILQLL